MMAPYELEETWDRSTEELRQTMLMFAERQKVDLRKEWIGILKRRFGEEYDRPYIPPRRLAEEHEKAQELQQTQIKFEQMKKLENSLGNFIEQVVDVHIQKAIPEQQTKENLELQKTSAEKSGERKLLENSENPMSQSIEHLGDTLSPEASVDPWVSEVSIASQTRRKGKIPIIQSYHKVRKKRSRKKHHPINDDFTHQYGEDKNHWLRNCDIEPFEDDAWISDEYMETQVTNIECDNDDFLLCGETQAETVLSSEENRQHGKSQLLQYIHKLSPHGIYTSGRGSSAVGLTAYVSKDPETGETVLESGVLVLSDRGVCCIDESDKMFDSARSMLHEVMEQQTISIAKAGISASINARTSVMTCANPSGSCSNPRLSVIENIHLRPTLLSRFDLSYLILDKPNGQTDRRLAKHIVVLHFENAESAQEEAIDITTLTTYVSYGRKNIYPKLSDEAAEELNRGYVELRKARKFDSSSKKVITATPRQSESLIRLSEVLARMHFSDWVEKHDMDETFQLLRVARQQSATDHATWTIDMDLINTGFLWADLKRITWSGSSKIAEVTKVNQNSETDGWRIIMELIQGRYAKSLYKRSYIEKWLRACMKRKLRTKKRKARALVKRLPKKQVVWL